MHSRTLPVRGSATLATALTTLLVVVALVALVAPAQAERAAADFDAPRTAIDPATALSSRLLLEADTESLLALHNPGEAARTVVVAVVVAAVDDGVDDGVDAEGDHFRQSQVVLEAGGHQALSLGQTGPASWLHVIADGAVDAEVETVDSGLRQTLVLDRSANALTPNSATDPLPTKAASCVGSWNLICIDPYDCTYISGYKPGRVVDGDQVYWNLHYPIASYVTTNGWCFTYWTMNPLTGCPTTAYNCLGETYSVQVAASTVDLDMQQFNLSTFSLPSGGYLNASWRVENFGNSYASSTGLDECLYLSSTNRIDGNETLLVRTPKQPNNLAPNTGYDRQVSTSVVAAPGTYWMIAVADCDNALGESNRDNNFLYASSFTVY